jgi:hypothetical protein
MKKKIAITVLALGMAMSMTSVTAQADSTQNTTVNVTVGSVTSLDVRPTELSYGSLDPGNQKNSSEDGYTGVEVENIGSNNISDIWAEASQPTTDPFGTGTSDAYDAGNFIQISTETAKNGDYTSEPWSASVASTDATRLHYVNRVEFSDVPTPTYIDTLNSGQEDQLDYTSGGITSNSLESTVGRFREGDEWYFYTVYFEGTCSSSSEAELWVGNDPHRPTELGTTDFTDTSNVDTYDIQSTSGSNNYGVTNSTVSLDVSTYDSPLNYDVFTYCGTGTSDSESNYNTIRTKFNTDLTAEAEGADVGTANNAAEDILSADGPASNLNPGSYFPLDVSVQLPQGVVNDDITGGELTLLAQAQ